jgi:hypothetical protein
LLDGVQFLTFGHTFDCLDVVGISLNRKHNAGAYRLAIK